MKHIIRLERVYADPAGTASDGLRVFVDRLWPRGESKEKFHYDIWAKEIAPSTELREWYHADPEGRWQEFVSRYEKELESNNEMKDLLPTLASHDTITLLYSSHDIDHNNAVVLRDYLEKQGF